MSDGAHTLKVASLFAGGGASSRGYSDAGLEVVYANEWDRLAADTYELNSELVVDRRSVEEITADEILEAVGGELDVLDASPPCQGFSTARGRRDLDDSRNGLYYRAIEIIGEVQPRAFAIENVMGLAKGPFRARHFLPILATLRARGYAVTSRALDASWLGVAQARRRIVVIGFKDELGIDPAKGFPQRSSRQTTMRDALPHAARLVSQPPPGSLSQYSWRVPKVWPASAPGPTILAGGIGQSSASQIRIETRDGDRRCLTVDELKALSGYPADFKFPEGASLTKIWKIVGNSVPPPMSRAWAERIRDALLERAPSVA